MPENKVCSDCGDVELEAIKVVEATHPGLLGASNEKSPGSHHIRLQYTAEDAERTVWNMRFPTTGHLRGMMCTQCGRVVLYAEPGDS